MIARSPTRPFGHANRSRSGVAVNDRALLVQRAGVCAHPPLAACPTTCTLCYRSKPSSQSDGQRSTSNRVHNPASLPWPFEPGGQQTWNPSAHVKPAGCDVLRLSRDSGVDRVQPRTQTGLSWDVGRGRRPRPIRCACCCATSLTTRAILIGHSFDCITLAEHLISADASFSDMKINEPDLAMIGHARTVHCRRRVS